MKPASVLILMTLVATTTARSATWQRIPSAEKRPVEVSANAIQGTSLKSSKGITGAGAMVTDDPTAPATLAAGSSEATINLGKQRHINTVSFVNDGIEGKASISASTDAKNWTSIGQGVFSPADRQIILSFAGIQAKYVRAQWELSRGGVIRHFVVYGSNTDRDFSVKQNASGTGGTKINLASGLGGSRVVYVHPNPAKGGDPDKNRFSFPESDEKYRTVIYDLGVERMVSEFGSVHSPRPVRFEVFTFTQLPEKQDWRGRVSFDPMTFETTQPVAQKEDARGVGYIKVKTDKPVRARYVALRWEPDFNPPAFDVGGTEISGEGFDQPQENNNAAGGTDDGGTDQPTQGDPDDGNAPPPYGGNPYGLGSSYAGGGGGGSLPTNPGQGGQGGNPPGGGTDNRPITIPPGQVASP